MSSQSIARKDASDISAVLTFWREAGRDRWFAKNESFDRAFRETFRDLHFAAARRELEHWLDSPDGSLALMLLLDQYPRNAFRGTGHMYATDSLARFYADRIITRGFDEKIEAELRVFVYLPFSHSEQLEDQRRALALNLVLGEESARHARQHLEIVERFGRFPHRNVLLGRISTPEEQAFLDEGGFAG